MNRFEILWCFSIFAMLLTGCAEFKEFLGLPSTQETAQEIVVDAVSGNYVGAITKVVGLGLSLLLAVLGIKKGVSAIKARRAAQ